LPELFIFKAGRYPQGDWPIERVQKFVDAYDPERGFEAPLVIGHRSFALRDADQYAHGWVGKLRMEKDGKVYADVKDVSREARQAIAEKKLRYVSVELYEFDKCKETQGQPPYLRAVALLGRDTPAVAGTRVPMFSAFCQHADEENHVTTFTRKVGAEDIRALSLGAGESTEEEAGVGNEEQEEIEKLKAEVGELKARVEALEKGAEGPREGGNGAFGKQPAQDDRVPDARFDKAVAARLQELERQDAAAFYGGLRDAGKLPPAQYGKAVALDLRLGGEERKEARALFAALEAKVDLSGRHVADKKGAPEAPGFGSALNARIKAYQKEHELSFADAASALFAAKPELFEEEEADA